MAASEPELEPKSDPESPSPPHKQGVDSTKDAASNPEHGTQEKNEQAQSRARAQFSPSITPTVTALASACLWVWRTLLLLAAGAISTASVAAGMHTQQRGLPLANVLVSFVLGSLITSLCADRRNDVRDLLSSTCGRLCCARWASQDPSRRRRRDTSAVVRQLTAIALMSCGALWLGQLAAAPGAGSNGTASGAGQVKAGGATSLPTSLPSPLASGILTTTRVPAVIAGLLHTNSSAAADVPASIRSNITARNLRATERNALPMHELSRH